MNYQRKQDIKKKYVDHQKISEEYKITSEKSIKKNMISIIPEEDVYQSPAAHITIECYCECKLTAQVCNNGIQYTEYEVVTLSIDKFYMISRLQTQKNEDTELDNDISEEKYESVAGSAVDQDTIDLVKRHASPKGNLAPINISENGEMRQKPSLKKKIRSWFKK